MKTRPRPAILAIALLTCLAAAQALSALPRRFDPYGLERAGGGAGGVLAGVARPGWNPDFMPQAVMPVDLGWIGGYGYGVGADGSIAGGFGFGFMDGGWDGTGAPSHVAGGVGGMIAGVRLFRDRWMHLDLATRLGLGGVAVHGLPSGGYAVAYAEPYLELGLGLTRWMRLTASVGYQWMGNIAPGRICGDFLLRSPTLGFSLAWGAF